MKRITGFLYIQMIKKVIAFESVLMIQVRDPVPVLHQDLILVPDVNI